MRIEVESTRRRRRFRRRNSTAGAADQHDNLRRRLCVCRLRCCDLRLHRQVSMRRRRPQRRNAVFGLLQRRPPARPDRDLRSGLDNDARCVSSFLCLCTLQLVSHAALSCGMMCCGGRRLILALFLLALLSFVRHRRQQRAKQRQLSLIHALELLQKLFTLLHRNHRRRSRADRVIIVIAAVVVVVAYKRRAAGSWATSSNTPCRCTRRPRRRPSCGLLRY